MPYIVRNISKGYQILLKHQIAPNGTLDIEEVFEGFCKPKKSGVNKEAKYTEWSPDQFDEFLEVVQTEYASDYGIWRCEFTEGSSSRKRVVADVDAEKKATTKREQKKKDLVQSKRNIRKAMDNDMSPKELAWLDPNSPETKKIIDKCSSPQVLKLAIRMARNLSGKERVRDMLDNRLMELGDRLI